MTLAIESMPRQQETRCGPGWTPTSTQKRGGPSQQWSAQSATARRPPRKNARSTQGQAPRGTRERGRRHPATTPRLPSSAGGLLTCVRIQRQRGLLVRAVVQIQACLWRMRQPTCGKSMPSKADVNSSPH